MHFVHWVLTENPFYPLQIVAGVYFGWLLGRRLQHRSMLWIWVLPLAILVYAETIDLLVPNIHVEDVRRFGETQPEQLVQSPSAIFTVIGPDASFAGGNANVLTSFPFTFKVIAFSASPPLASPPPSLLALVALFLYLAEIVKGATTSSSKAADTETSIRKKSPFSGGFGRRRVV